jgi:Flp pilus assembly protein TadG
MKTIASLLSEARLKLCRMGVVAQESGLAAVEFSLILPILLVLWIGGVEVTGALSIDRRLNNLASSMGDLVARDKEVTYAEVDDIFDLSEAALFPYSDTGITLRITAVDMNGGGTANVGWTRKQGTLPAGVQDFADGAQINSFVPEELRVPDSQIIMAEVYHTYTPAVGYVITGPVQLDDRMFFVPRLVTHVALCEDEDDDDCET